MTELESNCAVEQEIGHDTQGAILPPGKSTGQGGKCFCIPKIFKGYYEVEQYKIYLPIPTISLGVMSKIRQWLLHEGIFAEGLPFRAISLPEISPRKSTFSLAIPWQLREVMGSKQEKNDALDFSGMEKVSLSGPVLRGKSHNGIVFQFQPVIAALISYSTVQLLFNSVMTFSVQNRA